MEVSPFSFILANKIANPASLKPRNVYSNTYIRTQVKVQRYQFVLNGPNPASFCLFSFCSRDKYSTNLTVNDKYIDDVLGTRTQGGRMVDKGEST